MGDLSPPQLRALLDILIHHETYAEVESFQHPEAIEAYGWPFVDRDGKGRPAKPHGLSASPLLQLLLSRLVLEAPAARNLSIDFWPVKFKGIMRQLGHADLSDSYERGTLGTRKRLATAASVVHESITRGLLTGVDGSYHTLPDLQQAYNMEKAEDLARAWHDCISHLVYGSLIDDIFNQLTKTEDLEAQSPALKAAVEYAIFYISTFLHQAFILSAEGPYLLKLIENVHKLVPYSMIGQTLRVGNAASMINAMSKLFLSKVSVGAISNWLGLTSNAADGMNLLQRIISLVLDWDAGDFRKAAEKMKTDQESTPLFSAIDRHIAADRKHRDAVRHKSMKEQKSIIVAILEAEDEHLVQSLTDRQHTSCLEYYAAKLSIRDREHIIDVLCNLNPDLTTSIVYEALGALDPMIRVVHKKVDLRKHLNAMEGFIGDFIKTTKPKKQDSGSGQDAPTVEDFVRLLQRNRHLLWAYLHDFCVGCPELKDEWREWMDDTIKVFRQKSQDGSKMEDAANSQAKQQPEKSRDVRSDLQGAFHSLPDSQRVSVLDKVELHAVYLSQLSERSRCKMQSAIDDLHGKPCNGDKFISGPGIYALRWQALLDETLITPSTPKGPLRLGKDVSGIKAPRRPNNQNKSDSPDANAVISAKHPGQSPTSPDVSVVIEALGPQFKEMIAKISRDGLPVV
ncbi:hypothetical protein F4808DRAFT_431894 [Astrocystis sublimbata]|nr:hypothetical protein F4808DRAFT_431894 [Astrocystis sublimbata]